MAQPPRFKSRAEYTAWQQARAQQQQQQTKPQQVVKQQPQQQHQQQESTLSLATHMHYIAASAAAIVATVVPKTLPYFIGDPPASDAAWSAAATTQQQLHAGDMVSVHHPQLRAGNAVFMSLRTVHPVTAAIETYWVPLLVESAAVRAQFALPEGVLLTGFHFPGASVVLPATAC